jgi:hypothetical protein
MGAFMVLCIIFLSGSFAAGLFLFARNKMKDDEDRDDGGTDGSAASGAYPTAARTNLQGGSFSTTSNNPSEPLLGGSGGDPYSAAGMANSDADNMFAMMLAGTNGENGENGAAAVTPVELCPSCGKNEGIQDASNFCGLCGTKVR